MAYFLLDRRYPEFVDDNLLGYDQQFSSLL